MSNSSGEYFVMTTRSDLPDWTKGILCIAVLSLVIVSIDLAVEVIINPSGLAVLDRLLYRFSLMFLISFVAFIVIFRIMERQLFGVPKESIQSKE